MNGPTADGDLASLTLDDVAATPQLHRATDERLIRVCEIPPEAIVRPTARPIRVAVGATKEEVIRLIYDAIPLHLTALAEQRVARRSHVAHQANPTPP